MSIKMDGCVFSNCGTAISVPKGSAMSIDMVDTQIIDCGVGIEERDEPSLAQQIGLPADTPTGDIIEVIRLLKLHPAEDKSAMLETLKRSKLWAYVERSANVLTVLQILFGLGAGIYSLTGR